MMNPNNSGKASVIILTYNNLEYTRQCLDSIFAKTTYPEFEIIVVDNASKDGTREYLANLQQKKANLILQLNEQNEGFACANNQGAGMAQGEYLIFLNNDTVVTPGWLTGLISHLQDPQIGLVGPVTNAIGNEARIEVGYNTLEELDTFSLKFTSENAKKVFDIRMLAFFCVAMRRSVFTEIGPLDERFRLGMFEDDDYSNRVRAAGYRIICCQDVFIHHWSGASFAQLPAETYMLLFQENRLKYEEKWNTHWTPTRFRNELLDQQLSEMFDSRMQLSWNNLKQLRIIKQLESYLDDRNRELINIYGSRSWQFVQTLQKLRSRLPIAGISQSKLIKKIRKVFSNVLNAINHWRYQRNENRSHELGDKKLQEILQAHSDASCVIVFPPTIPWDVSLFQRPQQLALAFARFNCLVIYCEIPDANFSDRDFHQITDRLYLSRFPVDIFKRIPQPIVFTLAYNDQYLIHFSDPIIIYEYIDELEVFPEDHEILRATHRKMIDSADLVVTTATQLYQEILSTRSSNVILNPNAVDNEHIQQVMANTISPPAELIPILERHEPVIGYYGALAAWFDYDLMIELAMLRPHYQFVLIGPDFDGSIYGSLFDLFSNIHWLGPKPYQSLPSFLKYFDVATIPFKLNEITHSTSPLKLFEYMGAGKPVVCTAMKECLKYDPVLVANSSIEFAQKLDYALQLHNDPGYMENLQQIASQNSWEIRAKQILAALSIKD